MSENNETIEFGVHIEPQDYCAGCINVQESLIRAFSCLVDLCDVRWSL